MDPKSASRRQRRLCLPVSTGLLATICLVCILPSTAALHHMKRDPIAWVSKRDDTRPLKITNQCPEVIYPGIATQAGTPPSTQGFELASGASQSLIVSADWQGRVWGRTNCSFNADGTGPSNPGGNNGGGQACTTGDCNGIVNCQVTGLTPTTLAEFTLASSTGQTFYDISLVDGYNIPIGIVSLNSQADNSSLNDIPPNLTNPVCIATAALLAAQGSTQDVTLGSNASFPIPLEQSNTNAAVQRWCPWDLQLSPPSKPGNGVYPYPDDNIQRPDFDPCYSACAKYNQPSDCCTGSYDDPKVCKPGLYSQDAKRVCPDAYSYAFDDQTSTFIIPSGGGFEVIFCPPGRSSNILASLGPQLQELAQTGQVTPQLLADTMNATLIKIQGMSAGAFGPSPHWIASLVALLALCIAAF